jgi:UDP-3-O-[3-hydroxymyristoyl] N-acetylglucosamine deacetylase
MSPYLKQASQRQEKTLNAPISFCGIGVHTGNQVSLRLCPAQAGTGIVFKRVDLPSKPVIPASLEYVVDTSRSTTLGLKDVRVHTVEHVLSALRAYEIDNLIIEIDNIEPPVGNGSSDVFVDMIEKVGIAKLAQNKIVWSLHQPVYYSDGDIHIAALPSAEYRISYTLSYLNHPVLKAQFHSMELSAKKFKDEIAPCRTFSLYQELSYLIDKGLIKGGSLDNAVVIHDEAVYSKDGLFYPDEMVRHKILDMIGDLSLIGMHINAHYISIKSGHASNFMFAKKLFNALQEGNGFI